MPVWILGPVSNTYYYKTKVVLDYLFITHHIYTGFCCSRILSKDYSLLLGNLFMSTSERKHFAYPDAMMRKKKKKKVIYLFLKKHFYKQDCGVMFHMFNHPLSPKKNPTCSDGVLGHEQWIKKNKNTLFRIAGLF